MSANKIRNLWRKRECSNAQVIRSQIVLVAKLIARFGQRPVRAAESNDPNFGIRRSLQDRSRHQGTRMLEFPAQAVHIRFVILRPLAILGLRIVSAATGEICGPTVLSSR